MWLQKKDTGILDIFSKEAVYIESWGPEYHGAEAIKQWFDEWNTRGTVLKWEIKQCMGIDDGSPRLERLTWHLLSGKVQIHVDRAVKVAVRVSADVDGPLGGVVFVGFLIRGLLYLKHMIAPLIVLCPIVQIPFRHIGLVVVVAPKEVTVSVLLIELPCHIGVRGLGVFAQHKAAFVIKQDRAADHIALIFFQNNTSLMLTASGPNRGRP